MSHAPHIVYQNGNAPIFGFRQRYSHAAVSAIARRFFPAEMSKLVDVGQADETQMAVIVLSLHLPAGIALESTWEAGEQETGWVVGASMPAQPTAADWAQARELIEAAREGLDIVFAPHGELGDAAEFIPSRHTVLELKAKIAAQESAT